MAHYMFQTSTAIGIIIAIILLLLTERGRQIFITILVWIVGSIFYIASLPIVALVTLLGAMLGADMDDVKRRFNDKQNKKY